jgi:DNA-binding MarR family transcriptional regulator
MTDAGPDVIDATLSHGANVLSALARNLDAHLSSRGRWYEPPLDHSSARDALTLLGWRGDCTSETLQEALELSQPACVRVIDRLAAAGLVTRRRAPGERRLRIALTDDGAQAAEHLARESRARAQGALRVALADDEVAAFVAALDRVAAVAFGPATDTVRFCRSCDVPACLAGPAGCPSEAACRANLRALDG